jgi:phosphate transport system substrate-binding protein
MLLNNRKIAAGLGAIGGVATLTISQFVYQPVARSAGTIRMDGSSTVFLLSEAVAEEFQKRNAGTKVTVGVSGTGGGFKKFCRGEIDIANASRPITSSEMAACKAAGINYIELPVAYDALTVVINAGNTWAGSLTTAELKKMWEPGAQNKIKNWNQIRSNFPNQALKLFGPGANSGTFEYFTEAIVGKPKSSRGDFTASEDDNVIVNGVSREKGALGYFGYAYYAANRNRLKAVAVNGVTPNDQNVSNGRYTPLSRPLFIYVSSKAVDRAEIKSFVAFYLSNAPRLARSVKYTALPPRIYQIATRHFNTKKFGTVFAGDPPVGLTIEQLLEREARS